MSQYLTLFSERPNKVHVIINRQSFPNGVPHEIALYLTREHATQTVTRPAGKATLVMVEEGIKIVELVLHDNPEGHIADKMIRSGTAFGISNSIGDITKLDNEEAHKVFTNGTLQSMFLDLEHSNPDMKPLDPNSEEFLGIVDASLR